MHHQNDKDEKEVPRAEGDQYFEGVRKFPCFKCNRNKPACNGVKNCKLQMKEDGTPVNTQVAMDQKCVELNDAKKQLYVNKKQGDRTKHMMEGAVTPSYCTLPSRDTVSIEESGGSFEQQGIVETNVKVNLGKKDINFDMTKNTHRICNKISNTEDGSINEKCRKNKMQQTLLDNQPTCNVIINSSLLQNTRVVGWTLKIQKQVGYWRITHIDDMKGVGTMCFDPKCEANLLFQLRVTSYQN